jgi:hypothetical protein
MPAQNKRNEVNKLLGYFISSLQAAAVKGQTSYLFDLSIIKQRKIGTEPYNITAPQFQYKYTIEELLPYFQEKFPDCKLTYEEKWVDVTKDKKILKKGIFIDWS